MSAAPTYSDASSAPHSRRLLIVGAGGFGREVWAWASDVPARTRDWHLGGFLDANPQALDRFHVPLPILADPAVYQPQPEDIFVCAIADPRTKLRICRDLQSRGGRFLTFVHPTALVGPGCRIGEGSVLCPYSMVTCHATLGCFVTLNVYSSVAHDAVVGDGVTISGHCDITGGVMLEEGVFLGSHAAVAPRLRVPAYVKIGAGSVVYHKPRPGTTVMGVPARRLPEVQQPPRAA